MEPWKIIQHIESDNSKNFKVDVLTTEAKRGNDEFFHGLRLALHPLTTFGVKQITFSTVSPTDQQELPWDSFVELTRQLEARELTGHAARDAIIAAMEKSGQSQWDDWFRRILIQDMRAGFSESSVNKAVKAAKTPQYKIPVFTCMLAHDSAKHEKKVTGKKQIEVKLDGVRVLTIMKTNGEIIQTSRNGRELHNFGHTKDALRENLSFSEDMVLDGEIMSSNFQDLMTQVNRQSDVDAGDAVLNVFDILPLSEFLAGESTGTQEERSAIIDGFATKYHTLSAIQFLRSEVVDLDTDEGQARYKDINNLAIEGGYEGIMLKELDAKYQCKRSTDWLKLKPFITVDLEIIKLEEGTGKFEGTLGALVCHGVEDGKEILVNVGSGLTDEMRDDIWCGLNPVGSIVEVKADAITKSRDLDTYSLRFPRFLRFRGMSAGEKM
jgi:DNA ligase-1|tara:strand:+ start:1900 stop:3213 length:1314 start_codon:yes stop_codon:yes gene_type:complete